MSADPNLLDNRLPSSPSINGRWAYWSRGESGCRRLRIQDWMAVDRKRSLQRTI